MERASEQTSVGGKVADVQFAARRRGKADWRSRPAGSLRRGGTLKDEAISERMRRGLLLDGIR